MDSADKGIHRFLVPCSVAFFITIFSLFQLLPLWVGNGWVNEGNESFRYPELTEHFFQVFKAGVLYPRWLPELNGGYGYPTFIFYQPLFFWLALPARYISADIIAVMHVTIALSYIIGGAGCYRLSRLYVSQINALSMVLLFFTTPLVLSNFYERNDFTELLAILISPWPLYYLIKYLKDSQSWQSLPGLAFWTACLICAHPMVAVLCLMLYGLISVGYVADKRVPVQTLIWLMAAMLLAACMSAPYWWGFIQLYHDVPMDRAIYAFDPAENLGGVYQILTKMFYPAALLAMIALWHGRRRRAFQLAGLFYAISIVLMGSVSLWFWENTPLRIFQFGWRLMSMHAVLNIWLILEIAGSRPLLGKKTAIAGCLVYVLLTGALYHLTFSGIRTFNYDDMVSGYRDGEFSVLQDMREFDPKTSSRAGLKDRKREALPIAEPVNSVCKVTEEGDAVHIRLLVKAHSSCIVRINQFWFPGWHVEVNGMALVKEGNGNHWRLDRNGRIEVVLPQGGEYALYAYYEGPPHWRLRNSICLLLGLSIIMVIHASHRRARNQSFVQPAS